MLNLPGQTVFPKTIHPFDWNEKSTLYFQNRSNNGSTRLLLKMLSFSLYIALPIDTPLPTPAVLIMQKEVRI